MRVVSSISALYSRTIVLSEEAGRSICLLVSWGMLTQSRACSISVRSCRSPNRLLSVANRHQTARHKRRETCETYLAAMPQSAAGDQNSTGYAAALLARAQSQPERHWMDAAWLGGLTAAATATWAGLAAHPGVRLAALCYIAVEGLWYGWSKLRWVATASPFCKLRTRLDVGAASAVISPCPACLLSCHSCSCWPGAI